MPTLSVGVDAYILDIPIDNSILDTFTLHTSVRCFHPPYLPRYIILNTYICRTSVLHTTVLRTTILHTSILHTSVFDTSILSTPPFSTPSGVDVIDVLLPPANVSTSPSSTNLTTDIYWNYIRRYMGKRRGDGCNEVLS
ncbi:hypothetical protein K435DRAFT_793426 [Dendrothele bispora CBS 962.96]|uniref:Uncharacterized protein n=1 Tax=Dendrothele bispora (strain CBS 962.96) TaxID=1314807 RepID=A0A4S8MFD7_DENBC|nr:hypothetical protein K435DRAFT_793426 [Dendrothele bispora CBS 962.96]